ncbi:hypothetical protein KNP414_06454 [Paenibacillus mucilaginosus KNP414]|uniref:Uncharacterized protein n=1 Tax=Paenibacillus mucilaginosus (strain KNP414) TaxID=1036673 RepID=F8FN15_PAEMK|nr:hypothetical protein KNP414_06454 [Paenibacillus mucilaginosus KNP414]
MLNIRLSPAMNPNLLAVRMRDGGRSYSSFLPGLPPGCIRKVLLLSQVS